MLPHEHTVELSVQGVVLDTWDGVDISIGMLNHGSAVTFSLWWSESARSTWQILQKTCLEGADCSIAVDGITQMIGVIEQRMDSGGREGGMMVICCRSVGAVLAECDADPRISLKGLTLGDIFDRFLQPVGLTAQLLNGAEAINMVERPRALHVVDPFRTGGRRRTTRHHRARSVSLVDGWRAKPGQSIYQLLDEACRRCGYLMWESPFPGTGNIGFVVDVANESGDVAFKLERVLRPDGTYGGNILHAKHSLNGRGVPTEVTVFANNQLAAQVDAHLRASLVNQVRQDAFSVRDPFPRPWFRNSAEVHSVASAERVAGRMIAMATAQHRVYQALVQGYGQSTLYGVNQIVNVNDQFHNISENMLAVAVSFHRSRKDGEQTVIDCLPIGNLRTLPELNVSV